MSSDVHYWTEIPIVGPSQSGKTTFRNYLSNGHQEPAGPTVCMSFTPTLVPLGDKNIKLVFWELGANHFTQMKAIFEPYYHFAYGHAVFFDIGTDGALDQLAPYVDFIVEKRNKSAILFLIGTCMTDKSMVLVEDIMFFAMQHDLIYYKVDLRFPEAVHNVVQMMASLVRKRMDLYGAT